MRRLCEHYFEPRKDTMLLPAGMTAEYEGRERHFMNQSTPELYE